MQIGLASAAIKTATGDKFSVHRSFLHEQSPRVFLKESKFSRLSATICSKYKKIGVKRHSFFDFAPTS
jgi:hypothetical protein